MSIGGDFMEGRFFTAPLLAAAILVSRSNLNKVQLSAIGGGVLVLGFIGINSTLLSNSSYTNMTISSNGIADERGYYFQHVGLVNLHRGSFGVPEWEVAERKVEAICTYLGFSGIYNGPGMHYIDTCALTDPLLARLPAEDNPYWRIGHFFRKLPAGYQESIENNRNLVKDPHINSYYESIRMITRMPLNSPERLHEILRMNLGLVETQLPQCF